MWDAETGFGGDGEGVEVVHGGGCVRDGPFAQYQVRYINNITRPHCLSRGFRFTGQNFAPSVLDDLYHHDKLAEFSIDLEKHSHDAIPNVSDLSPQEMVLTWTGRWGRLCNFHGTKRFVDAPSGRDLTDHV